MLVILGWGVSRRVTFVTNYISLNWTSGYLPSHTVSPSSRYQILLFSDTNLSRVKPMSACLWVITKMPQCNRAFVGVYSPSTSKQFLATFSSTDLMMFRRRREKAFFAETQKFFPATAIYNAFCNNLIIPFLFTSATVIPSYKKTERGFHEECTVRAYMSLNWRHCPYSGKQSR